MVGGLKGRPGSTGWAPNERGMATQVMPGPAEIPRAEQTGWVRHREQGVIAGLRKEGLLARRLVPPSLPVFHAGFGPWVTVTTYWSPAAGNSCAASS